MPKSILNLVVISSIFISSCGGEKKTSVNSGGNEISIILRNSVKQDIKPNRLVNISITGMVSETNCVNSLKKLLSAMVGVTEIEIDFNNENHVNHALVKYDSKMIDDKQLVSAIEKLNKGSYKVGEVEIKKLEDKSAKKKSDEKEITFTTSSGTSGFALPNILDVFNIL